MKELDHQSSEALISARDADRRIDLDEDVFGGVDEDLQSAGLVEGTVKQGEEGLVGDVGAVVGRVHSRFGQYAAVVVAVEELEFLGLAHAEGFEGTEWGLRCLKQDDEFWLHFCP